jgi:Ca2+-binding RTX toxin-like protein
MRISKGDRARRGSSARDRGGRLGVEHLESRQLLSTLVDQWFDQAIDGAGDSEGLNPHNLQPSTPLERSALRTSRVWKNPEITVSFMPDGASIVNGRTTSSTLFATLDAGFGGTSAWQRELTRALDTWATYTPLRFVLVADDGSPFNTTGAQQGDPRFGDIRIGAYSIDGRGGTLAEAYYPPPNGSTAAGDVFIDMSENWAPGNRVDLYTVVLHEVGHALGLSHSLTQSAVMATQYNGRVTGLTAEDITAIQELYGVRTPAPEPPAEPTPSPACNRVVQQVSIAKGGPLTVRIADAELAAKAQIRVYDQQLKVSAAGSGSAPLSVLLRRGRAYYVELSCESAPPAVGGAAGSWTLDKLRVLNVVGSGGPDTISVGIDHRVQLNELSYEFAPGGVAAYRVAAGAGNDEIRVHASIVLPTILAGEAGNDVIEGGSGADWLLGGAGDDTLRGAAGDDYLEGAAGNDLIDDGTGNDRIVAPISSDNWVNGPGDNTVQNNPSTPTFVRAAEGRSGGGRLPSELQDVLRELKAELVDLALKCR